MTCIWNENSPLIRDARAEFIEPARKRSYLITGLIVSMAPGGLRHGTGWTFIVWGALHGAYLRINHAWRSIRSRLAPRCRVGIAERLLGALITFLVVVVAWVFFRAQTLDSAFTALQAMIGENSIMTPSNRLGGPYVSVLLESARLPISTGPDISGFDPSGTMYLWIASLLLTAWFPPNTQQIFGQFRPAPGRVERSQKGRNLWVASTKWAITIAGCAVISPLNLLNASEYFYFQS